MDARLINIAHQSRKNNDFYEVYVMQKNNVIVPISGTVV